MRLLLEIIGTNLGKALIVLPFVILGNSLFGAALAGFKERFDSARLKAGLIKGVIVYAGILMFALVSYYANGLSIDFNGSTYTLIDAMYVVIWATVIAYGKDGIEKLAKIFSFKTGNLEESEEE